jgi:hypothetical protein
MFARMPGSEATRGLNVLSTIHALAYLDEILKSIMAKVKMRVDGDVGHNDEFMYEGHPET